MTSVPRPDTIRLEDILMATELQLDGLTVAQKLQIVERVWDDLCQHSGEVRSPEWHAEVLAERKRQIEDGSMPISSWKDAKERLMKLGE